ncbi:MAG TPA: hypothetical protein G4O13_03485 [Dehalococcoidia bacterium]|nr:hypothetical protein [Dehalococcoidia bacterium]
MKQKRFLTILTLISIVAILSGTTTVYAQTPTPPTPAVIDTYTIKNIDGSDVTEDYLMAGDTYEISLEVNVGVDLGNNTLILSTPLGKVEDVYWHLENDYPGINTETWQPGQSAIEFAVLEGIAQLTITGFVPSDYTWTEIEGYSYVLHAIRDVPLIKLSLGPEGTELDRISMEVKDQAIIAYEQTLIEKDALLKTTDADPKYEKLATDIIAHAQIMYVKGYVEDATKLLNTIPDSSADFPVPVEEKTFLPYLIGIIALAVLLIIFIALLFKARANSSFIRQQVDEEAGRLDVLSIRVSKIDKQLARDLEQVKEQLERISGR